MPLRSISFVRYPDLRWPRPAPFHLCDTTTYDGLDGLFHLCDTRITIATTAEFHLSPPRGSSSIAMLWSMYTRRCFIARCSSADVSSVDVQPISTSQSSSANVLQSTSFQPTFFSQCLFSQRSSVNVFSSSVLEPAFHAARSSGHLRTNILTSRFLTKSPSGVSGILSFNRLLFTQKPPTKPQKDKQFGVWDFSTSSRRPAIRAISFCFSHDGFQSNALHTKNHQQNHKKINSLEFGIFQPALADRDSSHQFLLFTPRNLFSELEYMGWNGTLTGVHVQDSGMENWRAWIMHDTKDGFFCDFLGGIVSVLGKGHRALCLLFFV